MQKSQLFVAGLATVILCTIGVAGSLARCHDPRHGGEGWLADLTREQREAIRERIEEMRDEGASREEICPVLVEMLEGYGIELPDDWCVRDRSIGGRFHHREAFLDMLNDEQRAAVRERIQELKDAHANPKQIREAVREMIEEYGIQLPERPFGVGRLMAELTDEQRDAIHEAVEELKESGASREDIHELVGSMLSEYGVELPEDWGERGKADRVFRFRHRHLREHLTEEQVRLVEEKVEELKEQGATREQIHEKIAEMMGDWGVELPERPRPGDVRMRPFADLTEEQRRDLRNSLKELRRNGATREEIRQEIRSKLEEYGIELPRDPRAGPGQTLSEAEAETASKGVLQSYADPNPFEGETTIFYTLVTQDDVRIQIFNAAGQLVRDLGEHLRDPGTYSVQWDGTDGNGVPVPGGVYLYRIETDGEATTGRLVFLK